MGRSPPPETHLPAPRARPLWPQRRRGWLRSLRLRALLVTVAVALWPLAVWQELGWRAWLAQVLPVALGLGWWLGWRMVRPIELLNDQAQRRSGPAADDFDLDPHRSDEFGELAASLNGLLHRLDQRSQANARFTADVAHELKNQLAAVRGVAERLRDGPPSAERAARLAEILLGSSRRLNELVSDLLELTRAEAGMPGETRQRVDLASLCTALVAQLAADPRWSERLTLTASAPQSLYADGVAVRLEAAIRNLIENACHFAVRHVAVHVESSGDRVRITVADDGPGVPPEQANQVFERFYTTRPGQGTGLGLPLVRAIAEGHGGVAMLLPVREGATFALELPLATELETGAPAAPARMSDTNLV